MSQERDELQEGLRRSNEDCAKQVGPALPPSQQGPWLLASWPRPHPCFLPTDASTPGPGPELRAAATDPAGDCEPGPGAGSATDGEGPGHEGQECVTGIG